MRLTVLLTPQQWRQLETYCDQEGHKKSTLVARLIRDFLEEKVEEREREVPKRGG